MNSEGEWVSQEGSGDGEGRIGKRSYPSSWGRREAHDLAEGRDAGRDVISSVDSLPTWQVSNKPKARGAQ